MAAACPSCTALRARVSELEAELEAVRALQRPPHADDPLYRSGDRSALFAAPAALHTDTSPHNTANLLSVAVRPGGAERAVGCADGSVLVYRGDAADNADAAAAAAPLARLACGAPPLSLRYSPSGTYLAAACMDGGLRLWLCGDDAADGADERYAVAHAGKPHTKSALCLRWAPGSEATLATCSRDGTAALHRVCLGGVVLESRAVFRYDDAVDCLAFAGDDLVLAVRGLPRLAYHPLGGGGGEARLVSKNADSTDDHAAFNVLSLATSPDGRYLLAATDQSRHVVYPVGGNAHARLLVGHSADEYSTPRAEWHPSGAFVVGSSQRDNAVRQWDVASERVVCELEGHGKMVRDLHVGAGAGAAPLLATVSYDRTVRVWRAAAGVGVG